MKPGDQTSQCFTYWCHSIDPDIRSDSCKCTLPNPPRKSHHSDMDSRRRGEWDQCMPVANILVEGTRREMTRQCWYTWRSQWFRKQPHCCTHWCLFRILSRWNRQTSADGQETVRRAGTAVLARTRLTGMQRLFAQVTDVVAGAFADCPLPVIDHLAYSAVRAFYFCAGIGRLESKNRAVYVHWDAYSKISLDFPAPPYIVKAWVMDLDASAHHAARCFICAWISKGLLMVNQWPFRTDLLNKILAKSPACDQCNTDTYRDIVTGIVIYLGFTQNDQN